uniref:Murein DD-endopeptidase MepM and murein hydrolase activator NlpD, contain LysM domain n=1 Tax=Candidatus Kentrum sp. DK TaxID=2126562 RepID=A0A450T7Y1_9GAMM|nr:MAG: Murein DD-endopeptidase MepM and murein hydrolase activator NlpD, contain LysM domain [Candidatus Kentron sp. DK]
MQILLLSRSGQACMQLCVGSVFLYLGLFGVVIATLMTFLLIGSQGSSHALKGELVEQLYAQNKAQQKAVAETIRTTEENLDALALRLGLMHARAIRLEALGKRLTRMSGLDKDEFRFDRLPALGGPFQPSELETQSIPDFLSSLESLAEKLDNVEPKLRALENALLQGQIDSEVLPSGWPIAKGWISSPYGHRRDPLTGKKAFHDGIDFAATLGTEVVAVASGIVVWSGERSGYGQMVEISHGNGFSTRYAHNSRIVVKVGDTVRKGDPIAAVGDTGRSTGPHVHLEVLRNNRAINPSRFVNRRS